jgi:hypothetical protein
VPGVLAVGVDGVVVVGVGSGVAMCGVMGVGGAVGRRLGQGAAGRLVVLVGAVRVVRVVMVLHCSSLEAIAAGIGRPAESMGDAASLKRGRSRRTLRRHGRRHQAPDR